MVIIMKISKQKKNKEEKDIQPAINQILFRNQVNRRERIMFSSINSKKPLLVYRFIERLLKEEETIEKKLL